MSRLIGMPKNYEEWKRVKEPLPDCYPKTAIGRFILGIKIKRKEHNKRNLRSKSVNN